MKDNTPDIIKESFPVLGMTCASCASSAENIVKYQDGVTSASVNFATGNLTVEYQSTITNPETLQKAVQEGGYDLLIETADKQAESLAQIQADDYLDLKRKTYWAIILTFPVVIIGMFFMNMPYASEIMWVLSTPVVFFLGKRFFVGAWKQMKHRAANMDTLVALSTGIAYFFSVFNMLFQDFWHQRGLHAHVYFEAAAVIITFILLGKLLEAKAKSNTSTAIQKLIGLQPKQVTIINENGEEHVIPINQIKVGNIIIVKPGEKIAVDGNVTEGHSYVDESMLTGEPIAVLKEKGAAVYAGTINQKGSFQFVATKVGETTLLSQIIKTVQDAQGSKAPVQKLVDKIASIFVPIVIIIAIITMITWMILGDEHAFVQGLMAAVTVLVIACPCALGLATPTAVMVGIGKAAEKGILIKDAESLEVIKDIDAIILDKTGTITKGNPTINNAHWQVNDPELISILVSIEKQSEHPLATAVINHYNTIPLVPIQHFESITGKGARAQFNNTWYYIGNESLLHSQSISIDEQLSKLAIAWQQEAQTVIWFANQEKAVAVIAIADAIKPTSSSAIHTLKELGLEVFMLTGDNHSTASAVARAVGIEHFEANVLPQDKAAFVKNIQSEGKKVAMVGDGINDSTALATADISIAMGKGADIAMDVAKMTIISSDLAKISQAIQLSKQTVTTIRQNLFWAFIYNIIGIPIAAGIMYPINGFLLDPMIAGAAMALSSVSVVTNSLLLKWKKIK